MKKIILTKEKYAMVDDDDFENLIKYKWYVNNRYASRKENRRHIYMQKQIMNPPLGKVIDHINGDGLDNRKFNLRICTESENLRNKKIYKNNRSGFKGVYWKKASEKWCASIRFNKNRIHLGYFASKKGAALAYNEAAKKHFGTFARLNII